MKKIVSILVAVLVVFSMFTFVASAANAPTITAKANVSAPKVGDTVKVTVSTSANSKMVAATLSLAYDAEYFQVVGKSATEAFSMVEWNEAAGKVSFLAITNSPVKDDATTLFTVDFKVLKAGGEIKLVANEVYVLGEDGKDADVTSAVKGNAITFGCPHANKEETVTTQPTCLVAGEKTTKCKDCGKDLGKSVVPPKGHEFAEATVTVAPTCTTDGKKVGECKNCDAVVEEKIPATGHDYGKATEVKAPTCTEKGLKEGKCKNCDATVKEEIPTVAHKYGDWKVVTPATATKDGVKERVCADCGKVDKGVIKKTGTGNAGTSQPGDLNDPNTGVSLSFAFAAAGLALVTGTTVRRRRSK